MESLISIVSSLKAVTVMMLSGVMSLISTILSFAMLSVLLSSRKCCPASVLLLKKFLPVVIWNMNTASMFMPKPNRCDPKTVTKYIGRYLGRPVIATSRVDSYTGDLVSFHYNRHEDDQYVQKPFLSWILSNALSGTSLKNISR